MARPRIDSPERDAAIAAGQRWYNPGYPCPHGHTSVRYVKSNRCRLCSNGLKTGVGISDPEDPRLGPAKGRRKVDNLERAAAIAAGEKYYDPGRPCVRGHNSVRDVHARHCRQCVNEAADRKRKKIAKDPALYEKAKTKRRTWYQNNREYALARNKASLVKRIAAGYKPPKQQYKRKTDRGPQKVHINVVLDGKEVALSTAVAALGVPLRAMQNRSYRLKHSYQQVVDHYVMRRDTPPELKTPTGRIRVIGQRQKTAKSEHYLSNEDLLQEIAISQAQNRATDKLAMMMQLMAERFFQRRNYRGYSFVDEMREEALITMLSVWPKFNPNKSKNPFAYLTTCMRNSANRVLNREREQREVLSEQKVLSDIALESEAPGATSRANHERFKI